MLTEGYVKLWPTARYAHSGIDAFLDALSQAPEGSFGADDIERVHMRAYRLAAFLKETRVKSWFGTRFSIPFACATIAIGGRSGLDAFGDDAVNDPAVQAVYIGTPHPWHKEWAIKAAQAGKHVLCEKPLTLSLADTQEVLAAAQKHNVLLMEAYMYRFHPQTKKVVELVRSGEIGEPCGVPASMAETIPPSRTPARSQPRSSLMIRRSSTRRSICASSASWSISSKHALMSASSTHGRPRLTVVLMVSRA